MKESVLLGLCPIGKFVFSHEDAIAQKRRIQEKLSNMDVRFCDLDEALADSDGLVRSQAQVDAVVAFFKERKIDALFMPHCNFGTEGAVGMLAKKLGVPTLIWGPRDEAPLADGSRLRDSLCGMLASSKVVRKLVGNKYTYIENCRLNDPAFEQGLRRFLAASAVVKAARDMRIGLIGARIDFFWSCIVNESELLERFGIQVIPFETGPFLQRVKDRVSTEAGSLREELKRHQCEWLDPSGIPEEELLRGVAAARELIAMRDEYNLSAMTIQNFFSISAELGGGAAIYTMIAAEQLPLADESDIHGAVSMVLMNAARETADPVFFPEYVIRHPEDDDTVCLWHVGASYSVRRRHNGKVDIKPPWILPGDAPIQAQMQLQNGPLTVCRFDGDSDDYRLGVGEGEVVDGPYTRDYYGWFKVNNWPRWERQLIEGPYIHHCAAAYGHYADVLTEACKYLDIPVEHYGQ